MPTTTTNFGWTVPSDTDLVKDGAAAIRTALGGVDTSMVDLKGGTTGQVLAKASNTDMDFSWVAQDDSNAIQNAIVDAKGDLIGATAADTPARLAVGTDGQVLTADSTAATGLKWASAGSAFSGARVYNTATQSFSSASAATFVWNAESYDTNSYHDNSTNNTRLTVPTTGYYLISTSINWASNSTGVRILEFKKNGSTGVGYMEQGSDDSCAQTYTVPLFATAGDYFEVVGYQNSGGNLATLAGGEVFGFFSIVSLGA
jgi:hypothetical protein